MKTLIALLLLTSAASAQVKPAEVSEAEKIEALKLGYILNGNSMVRWGSIDLTGPVGVELPRILDIKPKTPVERPK